MDRERSVAVSGAWPSVALLVAVTAGWMAAAGLSLRWQGALVAAVCCATLEGLSALYRTRRPDLRLATATTLAAQLIALSGALSCLTYAAAATGGVLWDTTLMEWDRALGLDWLAFRSFVDAHGAIRFVCAMAYRSLLPQIVIVILVLGLGGQVRRGQEFVTAFAIAGLATSAIFALMPAMGIFWLLGLQPSDFAHIDPIAAYVHIPDMTGLREGSLRVIDLGKLEGIIPFPSFHAVLAGLFMRAFWSVPWARWPAVLLNLLLIASTPVEGGHYFVDVVAGLVVAAAATYLASRGAQLGPSLRSTSLVGLRHAPQ